MNKIIASLTAVASVDAADEFEVQKSGETVTKKATTTQLTQIEATARAAQDDVIETAVGLTAVGAYPSMEDTWYLRTVDHQGIIDRSGYVEDLPSDIMNALRILDYRVYFANSILIAEINLTTAQVKALHTDPVILITGEAGYVIDPIKVTGTLDFNTVAYTNVAADSLKFGFTGGLDMFTITNAFYTSADDIVARGTLTADEEMLAGANFTVYCDTAILTGNSPVKIVVAYRRIAV